jgi:hypothetical protein
MNSSAVDLSINYSNDIHLPYGSVVCGSCGYVKNHNILNDAAYKQHFTCLCLLFESAVICCTGGYCNLLAYVPSVALYTPLPQCTTDDHTEGLEAGVIKISKDKFDFISECAINAKVAALSNYPYLKSRFLPVQIVE